MDFSNLVVLFRVLWRKVWLIISVPIIAMIVTLALTWDMPDRYKSTAQLSTGYTTNDQILITNDPSSSRDINFKFNNLIETMQSEIILTLVSYRLLLHDFDDVRPFRKLTSEQLALYSQADRDLIYKICKEKLEKMELLSSFDPDERKVIDFISLYEYSSWQLTPDLQVGRIKDTDYVKIQFISEDPRLSAFVVNTLAEECIRYDNRIKESRSGQSVTFFENLMKEKKKILDEKTQLLNSYKSSNNVVNYSLETTSRLTQISEYELRRNEAISKIQAIKLSISNIDKRLAQIGTTTATNASNEKLFQLRSKIDELNKIYVDGGSKDETLKKTLSDLRYEYQLEMDKLASVEQVAGQPNQQLTLLEQKNQLELELEIANANLASINSALATLNNSVSGIANKEATVSFLMAEVENATKEYNEALDRYNTERNKSLVASSPLRLVVAGQPNGYPERSKRLIFIAFSGFASLIMCIATIVAIELLDLRLKNPDQFRKLVNLDLAGTLNHINSKRLNLDYLFKSQGVKGREMDTFKHFLRNLRYSIESSGGKTFLVTSLKEGEGKTFIILSLAYTLSLVKKRVLIIDTNFKHNSLTQELLAVNAEYKKLESGFYVKGLIGTGSGEREEIPEEDFVASIIFPTNHKGINVIGNSGGDQSPSEIFAGRDFTRMMDALKERYDYIFLEGAALNSYSDTKELVEYVDKLLPVFNSSSTMKRQDYESLKYLKSLNGKLMGSILNGIQLRELKV